MLYLYPFKDNISYALFVDDYCHDMITPFIFPFAGMEFFLWGLTAQHGCTLLNQKFLYWFVPSFIPYKVKLQGIRYKSGNLESRGEWISH
jgi:hypothetical protein